MITVFQKVLLVFLIILTRIEGDEGRKVVRYREIATFYLEDTPFKKTCSFPLNPGRGCFPRGAGLRAGKREVHDQVRQHRLGSDPEERPSTEQLRKLPAGSWKLHTRRQGA